MPVKFIVDTRDVMPEMIITLYENLCKEFGPLDDWWPAASAFERIAGAILVQQTRWENVDRVLCEMRGRGLMSPEAIAALPLDSSWRPSCGRRASTGTRHGACRASPATSPRIPDAFSKPADELRQELLTLRGVGDETADVLVLYVAGKPSFVVDAYARRTLKCMGIEGNYRQLQQRFHESLPADVGMYRHYHALFVEHGKRYCNKKAKGCADCAVKRTVL